MIEKSTDNVGLREEWKLMLNTILEGENWLGIFPQRLLFQLRYFWNFSTRRKNSAFWTIIDYHLKTWCLTVESTCILTRNTSMKLGILHRT